MKKLVQIEHVPNRGRERNKIAQITRDLSKREAGRVEIGDSIPCSPCGPFFFPGGQVISDGDIIVATWDCPEDPTITALIGPLDFNGATPAEGRELIDGAFTASGNDELWPTSGWRSWENNIGSPDIFGEDGEMGYVGCTIASPGNSPVLKATGGITYQWMLKLSTEGGGSSFTPRVLWQSGTTVLGNTPIGPLASHSSWTAFTVTATAPVGTNRMTLQRGTGFGRYDLVSVSTVSVEDCVKTPAVVGPFTTGGSNIGLGDSVSGSNTLFELPTNGEYILWVSVDGLRRTDYTFIPPDEVVFANPIPDDAQVFVNYRW